MEVTLATYPKHAGTVSQVAGHTVRRVTYEQRGDVVYQKFTADYRRRNARPFRVAGVGYGSLEAAVKAVVRSKLAAAPAA